MAESKEKFGIIGIVALAAIAFFVWRYCKKKTVQPEPATTESEIKDEFGTDPNFNLKDYCQNIVYRPLSSTNLVSTNLLGKGWCFKGDTSFRDSVKGYGSGYADSQAKNYIKRKQEEAILVNNKLCVQFRLINSTAVPITTDVLNVNNDIAPFNPAPHSPVASPATGFLLNAFTANWLVATGALGYYLDVATDNSFIFMVSGFNNKDVGDVLTYDITGLSEGTIYYYRLRAYNNVGTSVNSNIITAITIPLAPVSSPATLITRDSFTANWNDVTGALGYYLDVATDIGFVSFVSGFNNKDVGDVLDYSVTGLSEDTDYYYRIRAYNISGSSAASDTKTAKTKKLYNDWYLPAQDALGYMQTNLYNMAIGNLLTDFYWSSSEYDAGISWGRVFVTSTQGTSPKSTAGRIRPVRSFAGDVGDYSMGDVGPAGGWIFAYVAGIYYEAAPNDIPSFEWSNLNTTLLGTTSLNIEEGQNNTNEIIAQSGHVSSAAKKCDDYELEA
jgi:hypothetical protein